MSEDRTPGSEELTPEERIARNRARREAEQEKMQERIRMSEERAAQRKERRREEREQEWQRDLNDFIPPLPKPLVARSLTWTQKIYAASGYVPAIPALLLVLTWAGFFYAQGRLNETFAETALNRVILPFFFGNALVMTAALLGLVNISQIRKLAKVQAELLREIAEKVDRSRDRE